MRGKLKYKDFDRVLNISDMRSGMKDVLNITHGLYIIGRKRYISPSNIEKLDDFEEGLKRLLGISSAFASSIAYRLREFPWRSKAFGTQIMIELKEATRKVDSVPKEEEIVEAIIPVVSKDTADVRKQRKVPSSRIGRLFSFGQLAASLAWGWNSKNG